MIEVRVRCIDQEESITLGFFTPEEIRLIPGLFKTYPTCDFVSSEMYLQVAQFIIDTDGAYFEITVGEEV